MRTHSRISRVARGWIVGAAAMLVAALSHDLGGGHFPGWLGLLVGTVAAGTLGMLALPSPTASKNRAALGRLVGVVVIGQGGFHYVFSALGGPGSRLPSEPGLGAAHHAVVGDAGPTMDSGAPPASHLTDPSMLLAHLVAAVVTIALIGWAERAMQRLVSETARFVIRPLARLLGLPAPVLPALTPDAASRADWLLPVLHSHRAATSRRRRGPPRLSFA